MSNVADTLNKPLFRASKRRKINLKVSEATSDEVPISPAPGGIRRPEDTSSIDRDQSHPEFPTSEEEENSGGESGLSVAELVRLRKANRLRKVGIEFTNSTQIRPIDYDESYAKLSRDGQDESQLAVEAAINRFAPQTGQVADVLDKHMMAYVDSRLASHRPGVQNLDNQPSVSHTEQSVAIRSLSEKAMHRQPAGLGKLHEIDLGPNATLENIARTEAAKRRLEVGASLEADDSHSDKPVRLGKDGKPWRSRKRRNSEDIKRDKLVEEVLKETRLELYEEPKGPLIQEGDQAADDRIAEQFRREFMEAITSRHHRRSAASANNHRGAKTEEKSKGPKLGGSRSARAAMRAQEEKTGKKKAKP